MTTRIFVLGAVLWGLVGASGIDAQQLRPEPDAIVAALLHIRSQLPPESRVAVQTGELLPPDVAELAVARSFTEARPHAEVVRCVPRDNRRDCTLIEADAAIGIMSVGVADPSRVLLVVWRALPYSAEDRRWLLYNGYEVETRKTEVGRWEVVHSRLLWTS